MEHVEHTHESNIRRMDAEIGKLLAETARITDERRKMDAEKAKLSQETSWHPMTAIAAAVALPQPQLLVPQPQSPNCFLPDKQ